jgi:hypothetical protein
MFVPVPKIESLKETNFNHIARKNKLLAMDGPILDTFISKLLCDDSELICCVFRNDVNVCSVYCQTFSRWAPLNFETYIDMQSNLY